MQSLAHARAEPEHGVSDRAARNTNRPPVLARERGEIDGPVLLRGDIEPDGCAQDSRIQRRRHRGATRVATFGSVDKPPKLCDKRQTSSLDSCTRTLERGEGDLLRGEMMPAGAIGGGANAATSDAT